MCIVFIHTPAYSSCLVVDGQNFHELSGPLPIKQQQVPRSGIPHVYVVQRSNNLYTYVNNENHNSKTEPLFSKVALQGLCVITCYNRFIPKKRNDPSICHSSLGLSTSKTLGPPWPTKAAPEDQFELELHLSCCATWRPAAYDSGFRIFKVWIYYYQHVCFNIIYIYIYNEI